eukprot:CAMPEP_0197327140 /NCGR_PEP_ID=MMETSP0892-20130614/2466_1 /TAXON_ID=44058 ORGANISM="Aureoumbra lagunensis, Strain CCMP1510" /NCGR_SAMPLE_ID=MMETSP0892 /ASSEMBLY_ACC=CAM_ASM_000538 /LENGTH=481 /DNA_ID=CAMNT_0042821719 /DNA_START=1 /DNA_END=1447 /DNA_ORIENTATION=-
MDVLVESDTGSLRVVRGDCMVDEVLRMIVGARYISYFYLMDGRRKMKNDEIVLPSRIIYRIRFRKSGLMGGKGGFGAMLRSMGRSSGGQKTTDFGACRDLKTGQRLRHLNDEISLDRWHQARKRKEEVKSSPHVPSWIDAPNVRKTKKEIRDAAASRDWREEERLAKESGAQLRTFVGRVTMIDTVRFGFCVVDSECYVPWSSNANDSDDWSKNLRIGDKLQIDAVFKQKGRNQWAAYKAVRINKDSRANASISTKDSRANASLSTKETLLPDPEDAVAQGLRVLKEKKKIKKTKPQQKNLSNMKILNGMAHLDNFCARGASDFPTIAIDIQISNCGKWFYCVRLRTSGIFQIGWAMHNFTGGNEQNGDGVGDDQLSFAYDGCRGLAFNGPDSAKAYGDQDQSWQANDYICAFLDLDERQIRFSHNGKDLGLAFQYTHGLNDDINSVSFFPAFSLEDEEALEIVQDHSSVLTEGYRSIFAR